MVRKSDRERRKEGGRKKEEKKQKMKESTNSSLEVIKIRMKILKLDQ